jgi:hypothetical protein
MNGAPLGSIGDRVKHDRAILGSQRFLGLDALIKLSQLLGGGLADQFGQSLPVIIGNRLDLRLVVLLVVRLVVWLIGVGSRDLAVNNGLGEC